MTNHLTQHEWMVWDVRCPHPASNWLIYSRWDCANRDGSDGQLSMCFQKIETCQKLTTTIFDMLLLHMFLRWETSGGLGVLLLTD